MERKSEKDIHDRRKQDFQRYGAVPWIRQGGNGGYNGFFPYMGYTGGDLVWIPTNEASDYALMVIMTYKSLDRFRFRRVHKKRAATEWLRRYPEGEKSRNGSKRWGIRADHESRRIVANV